MLDSENEVVDADAEGAAPVPGPVEQPVTGALARRFVEMLLEDAGKSVATSGQGRSETDGLFAQFGFPDEEDQIDDSDTKINLPLDEVAVAVLLAASFESQPAMLLAIRREAPVVLFQAPDARSLSHYGRILRICALGRSTSVITDSALDAIARGGSVDFERRRAVIVSCDVDKRSHETMTERASTALSLAVPVCALSVDVGRSVPTQVRSVADHVVVCPSWNAVLLSILLETVGGTPIEVLEEAWIGFVTIDDLRMTVSRRRGSEASLNRLRTSVRKRISKTADLPHIADLQGYGEARRVGMDMLADIAAYRQGEVPWSDVPRGLVLAGPTGTGKTYWARCFARSAGLPLTVGSMASWQSSGDGHLGECLKAMKKSFAEARASAPSILFIDEIDSIGDRETFASRHRDYSSQVVNAMLEELDGASDRTGVVVLAATNHVSRIDSAILRPGRLDRIVTIGLPDVPSLAGILRTQLGSDLAGVDLTPVALAGRGGSGAAAAAWVRNARGIARRSGRVLEIGDLLEAVRDGRIAIPEEERRRVALHEAAHACSTIALGIGTVAGVSLHDTGGTTEVKPAVRTTTRGEAVAGIVHLLAGRAAEKWFLGSVSAGAGGASHSDLSIATKVAVGIEASWGLGDLGPLYLGDFGVDFRAMTWVPGLLPSVRRLLLHAEGEAGRLVEFNVEAIERCADRLCDAGYLDAAGVLEALAEVPRFDLVVDPPKAGGST